MAWIAYVYPGFMIDELRESFMNITYVNDETVWKKHIYNVQDFVAPQDMLDCSTECKVIHAAQGCQFFFYSVSIAFQQDIDFSSYFGLFLDSRIKNVI